MANETDTLIIGSGLSGLTTAHFLRKFQPDALITILEKSSLPGGAIRSFHQDGYLAEWGAHGFLDNVEASRELLADTGLDNEAQKAPLGKFVRYICLDGKLRLIPQNPKKIIRSNLVSLPAKLRVLADLWKTPRSEEQTVAQWAEYRFGSRLLPFVDAVLTGTYAGDLHRLSIDAVFPGIRNLELENGSVIKGLLKKKKKAKEKKQEASGIRLPAMVSFPQGMGRLPEALAVDKNIEFSAEVTGIIKKEGNWEIRTSEKTFQAKTLVLAVSVNQALKLLKTSEGLAGEASPVPAIPEAKLVTVALGFSGSADIPFGFGYLAPEQEKRFAMGALFSTHMFPGRAPEGHSLLEALVGGRRHPERLELADDVLIRETYNDLKQLIHLPDPPVFSKVLRTAHGIPQLEIGYPKLLAWRNSLVDNNPGLYVCGFGWDGIGINDMTKSARQVAAAVAAGIAAKGETEVKGIYF
ncbi:MAG: protoporphyrinogen oxidase [Deltaproteobacteria bacterium]|jgi:oxygen-dependent protoporphyrinogen oxidase|nr:protoporphyrinogen oxidase [Deltaproteobacteria bacterium]